jgi:hypothetical protein
MNVPQIQRCWPVVRHAARAFSAPGVKSSTFYLWDSPSLAIYRVANFIPFRWHRPDAETDYKS